MSLRRLALLEALSVCEVMGETINESPVTWTKSFSAANPKPYTVLALWSDHWPNLGDVFVNVMLAVMVLLTSACELRENDQKPH